MAMDNSPLCRLFSHQIRFPIGMFDCQVPWIVPSFSLYQQGLICSSARPTVDGHKYIHLVQYRPLSPLSPLIYIPITITRLSLIH